jgi:type IV secretion system protein VirB2
MHSNQNRSISNEAKILGIASLGFLLMAYAPNLLADDFTEACAKVGGFVDNLVTLLGFISVGVVTVAIIFAGYQISFAHKRFSDVAPILIGGLLIGGAAQIATWFMSGTTGVSGC